VTANTSSSSAALGLRPRREDYQVAREDLWSRDMRRLRADVGVVIAGWRGGGVLKSK